MGQRSRRIVGIAAMTIFVLVYIAAAMVIGANHFSEASPWVQMLYFAIAGLAWTLPAALVIKWMRAAPDHSVSP